MLVCLTPKAVGAEMVERQKVSPRRQWRDPNQLTPYEKRISDYLEQGMSLRQVTEALGGERKIDSVRATITIVKEKLAAAEFVHKTPIIKGRDQ